MSGAAIAARGSGLVKRFGETTALGGVSFEVAAGEIGRASCRERVLYRV